MNQQEIHPPHFSRLTKHDQQSLREALRDLDIRPLIKHRIFAPYDHAHNARIDEQRYNQRSMTETVNSAVKRSLGFAVRARSWFREFREIALMCRLQHQASRETVNSTALWRFNTAPQSVYIDAIGGNICDADSSWPS